MKASLVEHIQVCWDGVFRWGVADLKNGSLKSLLCKMGWGTAVYHIWKQRNDIRHGNIPRTEERIIVQVRWEVRSRIAAH